MNNSEGEKEEKKESPTGAPKTRRRPFEIAIPYYDHVIDDDDADGFFSPQFTRKERQTKFLERRSKRMKPDLDSMTLSRGADYLMYTEEQKDPPVFSPIQAINLVHYMTDKIMENTVTIRRYRDVLTNDIGGDQE